MRHTVSTMLFDVFRNKFTGSLGRTLLIIFLTLAFFFINLFSIYYFVQKQEVETIRNDEPLERVKENIDLYSCDLTGNSLAVSALARVKTENCRLKITEAACKLKNNVFHDKFPESTCNNHDSLLINLGLGCFSDSSTKRTLDGFTYEFKTDNSREKCRSHCYRAGFLHYGVEFGRECFCGDSLNATSIDSSKCQEYSCPGNESEYCGGYNAIDVYRTGLREQSLNVKAHYENASLVSLDESANSSPIKILFLLQLNGRNDRQVRRLLKAIYSPHHYYYIHVDQRQLYMLTEMKAVAGKLANVYVSPDAHSTIWGGASLLSMVQDAVRRSLSLSWMSDWDYLFNMSESDFPVMTLGELETQLTKNRGKSYLASHGYNTGRFLQKQGFDYVFMECEERMWRIGKRNEFPRNLRVDGGSDWLVLHRDFAEYSISDEELPAKMRTLFSSIILPVESFFHTLAYNSPFCDRMIRSHLRLTNWNRKQGCRCASLKKVVDWCGCSPLVFKKAHVTKFTLERAKEKAFYVARKFESLIDIDPIAIVEAQALRDRPELIQSDHPSFNSTFVNFYKADIDGYSLPNSLMAKRLLSMSPLGESEKFVSLTRIDIYKEHASGPHLMVFTIQVERSLKAVQLLVRRELKANIFSPAIVDGFQLKVVQFGMNIDHKEEIFRGITAFSDYTGTPTIALRWGRLAGHSSNPNKTSPTVKLSWRDATNTVVASQTVSPYDSIYGTQFADLDLSKLAVTSSQSGIWSVVVHNSAMDILANVSFPIFNSLDEPLFESLVPLYYNVEDSCFDDCPNRLWSTFYPDPKSDILVGYDTEKQVLRRFFNVFVVVK